MKFNYCPKCGLKLEADYKFCPKCGNEIPQETNPELQRQIDDFFAELENASEEEKDAFFGQLNQDLKKKGR